MLIGTRGDKFNVLIEDCTECADVDVMEIEVIINASNKIDEPLTVLETTITDSSKTISVNEISITCFSIYLLLTETCFVYLRLIQKYDFV